MEIVIAVGVLAAAVVAAALLVAKRVPGVAGTASAAARQAPRKPGGRGGGAETRSAEIGRKEERLNGREEALDGRWKELEVGKVKLAERERELVILQERHLRELERLSGLSASQAKQLLLKELEDQIRHDSARLVRQIEEETKRDADRRVRNILSVVMQRLAAG